MRLALNMGYSGTTVEPRLDLVREADRLGYHSVWVAEAYGSDAVSMLAWYGASTERIGLGSAIMQMPARTPAMTAMTAATLSELSGGRFLLGLGMSGPQVVEGWHGRPYGKPLRVTREYVEIVRLALGREAKLRFGGDYHHIPYDGPDATGLGKTLRLTIHPQHPIPIYLAAIPRMAPCEIADGGFLLVLALPRRRRVRRSKPALPHRGGGQAAPLRHPPHRSRRGHRRHRSGAGGCALLAFYVGAWEPAPTSFDLVCRYGYEEAATKVQELYLVGKREEAMAALPDALIDEVALLGPRAAIAEKLEVWQASGVTTLGVVAQDLGTLRTLAELVL
jgi:F420-dependent oxidoreductase-like protein